MAAACFPAERFILSLALAPFGILALTFALQRLVACNRTRAIFDGAFDSLSKR